MRMKHLVQELITILFFVLPLMSLSAAAGPTDAVSVTLPPTGQGAAFVPGVRLVENLPQEYICGRRILHFG